MDGTPTADFFLQRTRLTVRRVTTIIFHLPKNDAEAIELHLGVQLGFFLCMYAIMAIYLELHPHFCPHIAWVLISSRNPYCVTGSEWKIYRKTKKNDRLGVPGNKTSSKNHLSNQHVPHMHLWPYLGGVRIQIGSPPKRPS